MASGYTRLTGQGNGEGGGGNRSYGTVEPDVGFAPSNQSSTEFFQMCEKITTHLFTITNATSTLERSLKQVGSPADSQQLRDRITQLNSNAGTSIQETTDLLRTLQPLTRGDKQKRIQAERLQNEFQSSATRFSELQKKVVSTLRTARLPADMVAVQQDMEAASQTEAMANEEEQKRAIMNEIKDMEFETAMIKERELRVNQLESDIIDINDIMRDLASMVSSQGEVIDSIEENVEHAHDNVEEGRQELIKAASYQNKRRRRLCFCLMLLIVVLIIIAIILAIHFTKKK